MSNHAFYRQITVHHHHKTQQFIPILPRIRRFTSDSRPGRCNDASAEEGGGGGDERQRPRPKGRRQRQGAHAHEARHALNTRGVSSKVPVLTETRPITCTHVVDHFQVPKKVLIQYLTVMRYVIDHFLYRPIDFHITYTRSIVYKKHREIQYSYVSKIDLKFQ